MTYPIVNTFNNIRNYLYNRFRYRADATMDLIDATAGQTSSDGSVVKISLNPLFRRGYSSITDAIHNLFCKESDQPPTKEESKEAQLEITKILAEACPKPVQRSFRLLAVDCTAYPRIHSEKVEDRSFVHTANHVPGQKPITVGHQYSSVVFLPENQDDKDSHWVVPLSVCRVEFSEKGHEVGMVQIKEILENTVIGNDLCVVVADSAYNSPKCTQLIESNDNWVVIARLRNNRNVYRQADQTPEENRKRGRPKTYGERMDLKNPPSPDKEDTFEVTTKKGKVLCFKVKRWNNVLVTKESKSPFDLVQVTLTDQNGTMIYKKPLTLSIKGARRGEVDSQTASKSYSQRFDIEHYYRFGKQKLLAVAFETPDTRHEENWMWINMIAYNMLYHSRNLATATRHPWENRKITRLKTLPPAQVQRDYIRIIQRFGTPSKVPKPRGKSSGREEGVKLEKRTSFPVQKKPKKKAA